MTEPTDEPTEGVNEVAEDEVIDTSQYRDITDEGVPINLTTGHIQAPQHAIIETQHSGKRGSRTF